MYNIFKFYNNKYDTATNKETLSELYIFIKNLYYANELSISIEELNEDYTNNSKDFLETTIFKETFEEHFTDLDKSYINDYEPKIYFINENIYYDDTIETIKFKFLKHYNNLADTNAMINYFNNTENFVQPNVVSACLCGQRWARQSDVCLVSRSVLACFVAFSIRIV